MISHLDEAKTHRNELGHLSGTWADLGRAAGSGVVGLKRIQVDPGKWSTPAHAEGAEEEIFYVLDGSDLSRQNGEYYDVRAGDCLVHLAGGGSHTLRAGDSGLDVLASAEEELFVILEGDGTLELTPSPELRDRGVESEEHAVQAGHVISRRAGTGVAHAFRGGDGGLTMLAYGTKDPNDIVYYPGTNKIYFCGVGVIARLDHLAFEVAEESTS